jgi:xanthine dehydrogenase/oxidase
LVLAETRNLAREAAALVVVDYEPLPAIFTIEEAIAANSYLKWEEKLQRGEFDADTFTVEADSTDRVFQGRVELGGQEHMYMETNGCLIIPKLEDNEYEVHSSTQYFTSVQTEVAKVLEIPMSRVVAKVKRIGGAFGGKETTSARLAMAAAVGAKKTNRPVRCVMDREVDMINTGKRHPYVGVYKLRVSRDGFFKAYECDMVENAGWSMDGSPFVMAQAVNKGLDNCYFFPKFKATGKLAKTNTPSNTA